MSLLANGTTTPLNHIYDIVKRRDFDHSSNYRKWFGMPVTFLVLSVLSDARVLLTMLSICT